MSRARKRTGGSSLKLSAPPGLPFPGLALRRVKLALLGHASLPKVRERKSGQARVERSEVGGLTRPYSFPASPSHFLTGTTST